MARVALPCLVLIHILLAVALVSMPPGPTRTRLQCPGCSKAFESETGLRQHRAALGRKGGPAAGSCMFDTRLPIKSGWSGRGQRAAGFSSRGTHRQLSRYRTFIFSFHWVQLVGVGSPWPVESLQDPRSLAPAPPRAEVVAVHHVSMVEKSGSVRSASPPIWELPLAGVKASHQSTHRARL